MLINPHTLDDYYIFEDIESNHKLNFPS